jgi:hypothetical protein
MRRPAAVSMSRKERAMSTRPNADYQVGYAKPPQRTQFTNKR